MRIAVAQIAPILLDREATTRKIIDWIARAAEAGAALVAFGETILPAYPLWLCRTDAARFEDRDQKELHALYLDQAVSIADRHLAPITDAARKNKIAVVLGIAERAADRGGHTIYCSRVMIDAAGEILSVHRKLMPTYEERLAWGTGDGSGLVTHRVGEFTVGGLNCWENWMPLARAALYAAGENLHIMLWPGCLRLTQDITRFVAKESRSFVVSACGLIRASDVPDGVPLREKFCESEDVFYDGGSCVAGPDGNWIIEPQVGAEGLFSVDLDISRVLEERQNFDPVGHYARPDVLRLIVDRRRQDAATFLDDGVAAKSG